MTIAAQVSHPLQPREQADLRPHAGEREERRQQQDRDEILHLFLERACQPAVVGNHRAQQEGAEDRMNADRIR